MVRSKGFKDCSEVLVIDIFQAGKGYKAISWDFGLQRIKIRFTKESWKASSRASLLSFKASVHDSTIEKRPGKNGVHESISRWKTLQK